MIQVKEFNNMQDSKEYDEVNKWLEEKKEEIKVIDIKFGVSCFPPDIDAGWNSQNFSGCLIVYKPKKRGVLKCLFQFIQ